MVTMALPVEYGPVPEEEEQVPTHPEDPPLPAVMLSAQMPDGESSQLPPSYPSEDRRGERAGLASAAPEAKVPTSAPSQPCIHQPQMQTSVTNTVTSAALSTLTAKGPHQTAQPSSEGGHINLAFTQGHPQEKEGHGGKNTSLWNPTYGSWFLQQQRQGGVGGPGGSTGRVPGEGQEHVGRTVSEVAGSLGHQHQHKQFQHQLQQQHQLQLLHHQQQQQQGLCRLPPPAAQSPLLLDSTALPPVPLYRLRRFPCGNIGYGYQEPGLPLDTHPTLPHQGTSVPPSAAHQRGASMPAQKTLGRAGMSEDSRPLLVTMGTVQDTRLPRMEGHNATVL